MIKVTHGAYARLAHLECDSCGVQLGHAVALRDDGAGPNPATRDNLRQHAQDAGWTAILMLSRSDAQRDLCPLCFKLPPEG